MAKKRKNMAVVNIIINGKSYQAEEGENLLEFLLKNNFPIPHLCKHPDFSPNETCRLCLVEIDGKITTSCNVNIKDGLNINTKNEKINKLRAINAYLLNTAKKRKKSQTNFLLQNIIEFDWQKCIDCGLCIKACENQKIKAIKFDDYGIKQHITPTENPCIACGQCLIHCPANAISTNQTKLLRIKNNLKSKKIKIAQIAPSVRTSIGELFDIPHNKISAELVVAGLKKLGFDYVFDTAMAADITTIEEAKELIERLKNKKDLPMFTSCCPGWVNYILSYHPELRKNLTTVLPPEIKMGNFIKHYFAKKMNFNLDDVYVISIMPCTAKKWEIKRKELKVDNYYPVDDSLTTVEIAQILKEEKIDLKNLTPVNFDHPLGDASGAGVIYGTTGGVMTSALRTAYFYLTGKNPKNLYFDEKITSFEGIKVFEIKINDIKLKIAIVNGLGNFSQIIDRLNEFQYIEVMACPGGCLSGGGQPKPINNEIRKKRKEVLLKLDKKNIVKFAHENEFAKKIYQEFLTDKEKIHKYCHTYY
ncbi:MAG: 2Fe-2S iron-sulfur cluster-binding protein [Patescibacteria group bacterium]|nr:2Fe-2S iron-sulfur cluster-binding protein [Patescibacteria group bacterium]